MVIDYLLRILNKIKIKIFHFYYHPKLKYLGDNVKIISPLQIDGTENISIGNNSVIQYKTWLAAVELTGQKPILHIGKDVAIGRFNHIYATGSIVIEENVLSADKVYISDNLHSYEDISIPIMNQKIRQVNHVVIGSGSWIGENACIIGAKIGKNCVIGANSVVTKDVPDYCIVVGIPSKIIKRYDQLLKKWRKTDLKGEFLK